VSKSRMTDAYHEGYWERGEGSNYVDYGDDPGFMATAAALRSWLPSGARVYELGAAKGFVVFYCRQFGLDAEGVDISSWAIDHSPRSVRRYLHRHNAADPLPWPATSADCVLSLEFLEHIPESELLWVLENALAVLKPGGLMLHRIGILRPPEELKRWPGAHDDDATHVLMRRDGWWRELFGALGWQRQIDREAYLNTVFADRDWSGRHYVYRAP
jgi:cyclopropane fatty-acyl-phospholipid synthase-like methyltransferase